MRKFNLIIVDDHSMFREGLQGMLETEEEFNVVFGVKNGNEILKYLEINSEKDIDLIISDISMPEITGIELTKLVKDKFPKIKVLIVSMHTNAEMIEELIQYNVDGYLSKSATKRELIEALNSILSGKKFFSRTIKDVYFKKKQEEEKNKIQLTKREIDVITLIAKEHTTQEIADQLFLSKHTIESYRKTLISKLGVRNLAGLTRYAIKMKYIE
ncbi:response regulator transcription factor [Tenacibaculum jejuense]|uniref:Two-component system response regulator, LuxR fa mily n=1 Tax=Tenacibaculum jejuense TaxID=584609 RepID=A0A238UEC8_9FLAO|nr:response regulator transcription factor [Tenacibaculum jejuense]SNR17356.1 Two-component system response regulator, LuxR fa mily [Tenacibaculum jejuense]